MRRDRLLNEKLEDLPTRIDGFRVLILHNDLWVAERMLVKILNALKGRKIYFVIYSNTKHMRLEKLLKLCSQNERAERRAERADWWGEFEVLREVEIIKVGTNGNTCFGRIQRLVDPHYHYPDTLIDSIYRIDERSVIVFYGFVLDDFEHFLEILDNVNSNSTVLTEYPLVEYEYYDQILREYHDVIIKVQRQDLNFSIVVEPRVPICEEVNVQLDPYDVRYSFH